MSAAEMLNRLGLSQYTQQFSDEGFDTWETLMDITESDLDALGVKLGHRRKLQRAIVDARGHTRDHFPMQTEHQPEPELTKDESIPSEATSNAIDTLSGQTSLPAPAKRKYRRHPKPDNSAPDRPPSAYVIFSNQMREVLRGRDMSFTEIAKLVGERWQDLDPAEKEPCEQQAQALKERYYSDLSEYKKTPSYSAYQRYLADFKAKHSQPRDSKRQKTDGETSQSRRSSSPERLPEDIASRTDESALEPTSPGHVNTYESAPDRVSKPSVLHWRSGVEDMSSAKTSPTSGPSYNAPLRRLPPLHYPFSNPNSDAESREVVSGSASHLATTTSAARPQPPLSHWTQHVADGTPTRHDSYGWRASTTSDGVPPIDDRKSSGSSVGFRRDDSRNNSIRMNGSIRDDDEAKNSYQKASVSSTGSTLPFHSAPREDYKTPLSASTTRPSSQHSPYSKIPWGQSRPPFENPRDGFMFVNQGVRDEYTAPRSPRELFAVANSKSPYAPDKDQAATQQKDRDHVRRYDAVRDENHRQTQKTRASMGFATLLRASEHLDRGPESKGQSNDCPKPE